MGVEAKRVTLAVPEPMIAAPVVCFEKCGKLRKIAAKMALEAFAATDPQPMFSDNTHVAVCSQYGRLICHANDNIGSIGSPGVFEGGKTAEGMLRDAVAEGAVIRPISSLAR